MSDEELCFYTIVATLVFIGLYSIIWKKLQLGGPSLFERADKAFSLFTNAKNWMERIWAVFIGLSVLLLGGSKALYVLFTAAISTLPFAACNYSPFEILRDIIIEIRKIVEALSMVRQNTDVPRMNFEG